MNKTCEEEAGILNRELQTNFAPCFPEGLSFISGTGTWGTFFAKSTTSPTVTASDLVGPQFPIQLSGTPGINYAIRLSTNLALSNWTAIVTNSPTNGTFNFKDPNATNASRFYLGIKQ